MFQPKSDPVLLDEFIRSGRYSKFFTEFVKPFPNGSYRSLEVNYLQDFGHAEFVIQQMPDFTTTDLLMFTELVLKEKPTDPRITIRTMMDMFDEDGYFIKAKNPDVAV
jgi:hypothetical protein